MNFENRNITSSGTIRLRELDFLRGAAIILVLFNHKFLLPFLQTMGWIGVDLFFVLSGFLVSGLLFKELIKFGNLKPGLFLIRRGFKIYPIYYLFYWLYFFIKLRAHDFSWKGLILDLTFLQNYFLNWSYAFPASWSLAVEEHFYIFFVLFLYLAIRLKFIQITKGSRNSIFTKIIILFLIMCLFLRIFYNYYYPDQIIKNTTKTHLRIDSLLAGVLISYFYFFNFNLLKSWFHKQKKLLFYIGILFISFTPFIDRLNSVFVRTIGFTMIYISFSIVLLYFLFYENINSKLNKYLSKYFVDIVCKIGFSSYSIYVIHGVVNYIFGVKNMPYLNEFLGSFTMFYLTSTVSVCLGYLMTAYVESFFLKIRDKYYPIRIA